MLSILNYPKYKDRSFKLFLLLVGLGISILIYLPGLPGDFVHDDFPNIVLNEKLHLNNFDSKSVISASFSSESGPLRRPISTFTFAVNYYFSELNPLSYKLVNIVIHLLVGLSLFFLTRILLDSYEKLSNVKINRHRCFYIALITALAWLVSPINLTAVLYVVQRMTSLSALFSVLGLYFYVVARRSMIFRESLNYSYFLLSGLCFLTALFCKENAVLNIFYLIFIEVFFLRFVSNSVLSTKSFRLIFLTLAITPIAFIVIWLLSNPTYILNGYEHRSFSLPERVLTQTRVLFYYLKWIVAPNITELGLFHDDLYTSKSLFDPISTFISIILISLLLAASIVFKKTKPFLSFAILFFFSSHLLESSIIPLEIVYEHRNYLASFGVIFGIFATLFYTITDTSTKKLAVFIYCIWFCAIATTTGLRASQWKDSVTQAYYEVSHHPTSARATFDLGRAYANLTMMDVLDEKDKAIKLFEKSMKHMPYEIAAEAAAISFSSRVNIESKPEWIDNVIKKLGTYPITHITIESLNEINRCLSLSCSITVNQAFEFYKTALNNPKVNSNRYKSNLLTLYAEFSANNLGELDIAYHAMKDAIELNSHELQYRINFIMLSIIMKKYDEASLHISFVENNDTFHSYSKIISSLKEDLVNSKNNTKM